MFGFERVDFYGLGLLPPFALQVTRYPPGTTVPVQNLNRIQPKRDLATEKISMNVKLNDYQKFFRDYASGILNMSSGIVPPSHPLYARKNSLITLQDENNKLKKENFELKKQLDSISKKSSVNSSTV